MPSKETPSVILLSQNATSLNEGGEDSNAPQTSAGAWRESCASLCERIAKLGGTDYSLAAEDCKIDLDEGLFLTPAAINALRREAVEDLDAKPPSSLAPLREGGSRDVRGRGEFPLPSKETPSVILLSQNATSLNEGGEDSNAPQTSVGAWRESRAHNAAGASPHPTAGEAEAILSPREIAVCYTEEQARAARQACVELVFLPIEACLASRDAWGVAMPPVIHDHERARVMADLSRAREKGATVALATNIAQIAPLREMGFTVVGDLRLNAYNQTSAQVLREMGVCALIPSPELSLPQVRDLGTGVATVYGRMPLMLTERCFIKENFGCDQCGRAAFTDRRGARFPLLREREHRTLILNSLPTYMGDRKDDLTRARIKTAHFLFTVESGREVSEILSAYRAGRALDTPVRRMGRN